VRVGGRIRLVTLKEKHPEWNLDRDYYMEGTIMEIVPNKRLSYSWKFKDTPNFPATLVTWELEQINPNKTLVKLSHVGFSGKEKGNFSVESHTQGWTEALDKLAGYCES
ncbi:MAG: SRPBCC domain-containing protein, partial [Nitrososphaeraceae archaeon]|nr:SRPBCC domain-containing protein [Nitrososphaeraceae archaeon]